MFDGMLLMVGGALAGDLGCCCDQGCCCLDFENVNFSFTIDCGGGDETFTGILNFGAGTDYETGLWSINVICTTTYCTPEDACDPLNSPQACVGYIIVVSNGACGANALYLCPGTAEQFIGSNCENAPQANFTADLFKCVGGVPVVIGSITFFP